ncbi:hypothetical protein LIER_40031 [Lithospermum erythrorhizon]|uniref:Uncharacterized protein n=1 Tax=Lithospermum erythrorhizon TaxID=34254 RepID=A0AAV3QQ37_LITER
MAGSSGLGFTIAHEMEAVGGKESPATKDFNRLQCKMNKLQSVTSQTNHLSGENHHTPTLLETTPDYKEGLRKPPRMTTTEPDCNSRRSAG